MTLEIPTRGVDTTNNNSPSSTTTTTTITDDALSSSASSTTTATEDNSSHDSEKGLPTAYTEAQRLGKERPAIFKSTLAEVAFVASILVSLCMSDFVITGFNTLLPSLIEPLGVPQSSRTWPSSVLTLVVGSFLFPMGRLADMYGGYYVFTIGMSWFALWTLITGFTTNFLMLVACRAMAGLGAAAFLPSGITILGRTYSPGPRKNLVFSLYGAFSPVGFLLGTVTGGVVSQTLSWRWYFWIGGIISGSAVAAAIFLAPNDYAQARKNKVKMDWWGLCTLVPGIMLVIFSITESAGAPGGWTSPRIFCCLIAGVLCLGAGVYVEGWVAEAPFIPSYIFKIRLMKRMLTTLFLTWGAYAMFIYFTNFYIQEILGKSTLVAATWYAPWTVGGFCLATLSGLVLHRVPGRVLLIISGVAKVLALLFFVLMPDNPNYWAWVMPAMVCEAACVNVLWTVSNVFLTSSLPKKGQGLAGAIINVTLYLGNCFFLGTSSVASAEFEKNGWDQEKRYKGCFVIGTCVAGLALFICFFMKLDKATGGSNGEEDQQNDEMSTGGLDEKKRGDHTMTSDSEKLASDSIPKRRESADDSDTNTECGAVEDHKKRSMDRSGLESEASTICDFDGDEEKRKKSTEDEKEVKEAGKNTTTSTTFPSGQDNDEGDHQLGEGEVHKVNKN